MQEDIEIKDVFKKVLRDQLIQENTVKIEDLGVFSPGHRTQRKWEYKNGKVVLLPPKDYLEFKSIDHQE